MQTDPTLLGYASAITEQKKCWELFAEKFDRFQTLRNNIQQGVQTDATCNIQQCRVRLHGAWNSIDCNWRLAISCLKYEENTEMYNFVQVKLIWSKVDLPFKILKSHRTSAYVILFTHARA